MTGIINITYSVRVSLGVKPTSAAAAAASEFGHYSWGLKILMDPRQPISGQYRSMLV